MECSPETKEYLTEKCFTALTPIQTQTYKHVYQGVDVVARSKTGTGKTLAFGIPLMEKIVDKQRQKGLTVADIEVSKKPLIIILEPTRELVIQVTQELRCCYCYYYKYYYYHCYCYFCYWHYN